MPWDYWQKMFQFVGFFFQGLVLVCLVGYAVATNGLSKESASSGKLEKSPKTLPVRIGFSGTLIAPWDEGKPIVTLDDEGILFPKIQNGRLSIDCKLYNKKGELLAKIENNKWKVNPNKIFSYNFKNDALEVTDESGDVVLQLIFEGGELRFQGKFYGRRGSGIAFYTGGGVQKPDAENNFSAQIPPIFDISGERIFP
ncbi:MAG TPA: hypothetical protein VFF76_04510 [Holophagaceae bacterium]|jgi:hypothetical protein|nr:hypothetical protein [Holophagaceae bacterium]